MCRSRSKIPFFGLGNGKVQNMDPWSMYPLCGLLSISCDLMTFDDTLLESSSFVIIAHLPSKFMFKFLPVDFLSASRRVPWKNENAVYRLQISALVPEIFKFEKWEDWWRHTLNPILYQVYKWGYLGQFAVQNIEIWQADSSTENTPIAIKNSFPMAVHSFPVPTHLISIC